MTSQSKKLTEIFPNLSNNPNLPYNYNFIQTNSYTFCNEEGNMVDPFERLQERKLCAERYQTDCNKAYGHHKPISKLFFQISENE